MATNHQQTSKLKHKFDLFRFQVNIQATSKTRFLHKTCTFSILATYIYGSRSAQGYCMNDVGEVSTALSPEAKILLADSAQERLPPGSNLKDLVCLRTAQYPTIHWFINHQFPNSDGQLGDIHHFQTQPIGGKDWSRSWLRSWNQKTICWQSKQIHIQKKSTDPTNWHCTVFDIFWLYLTYNLAFRLTHTPTFQLTYIRAFYLIYILTFYLTVYLAFYLTFYSISILHPIWHIF